MVCASCLHARCKVKKKSRSVKNFAPETLITNVPGAKELLVLSLYDCFAEGGEGETRELEMLAAERYADDRDAEKKSECNMGQAYA